jgi:uncharacterized iron-regulated membrane protein
MWFSGRLSGKARDFNWHNVFGFWCCIPLFFVVISAVPISYTWAGDLLYRITGSEPPRGGFKGKGESGKSKSNGHRKEGAHRETHQLDFSGLNALWDRAQQQDPEWQSISFPLASSGPAVFSIDTGDGGQPQKRSTLTLNRTTTEPIRWQTFADGNAGQRLRSWMRFTHTGEAFGLAGQTIAGVASAGAVMLVWTGISLALRRFAAWQKRRQRVTERRDSD